MLVQMMAGWWVHTVFTSTVEKYYLECEKYNAIVYLVTSLITSLVAIYFSESCNISPVRVSNRKNWDTYR